MEHPSSFMLDDHHTFEKGKNHLVCGNTFLMLNRTRFQNDFIFHGDMSTHYGLFPCDLEKNNPSEEDSINSCC